MSDRYSNKGDERGRDRGDGGRDRGGDRGDDRGGRDRGSDRDSGRGSDRGGSRGSSRYTYQPRDKAAVDKRASQGSSDFDKIMKPHIKMWTPKSGNNRVRILPPTWEGAQHYGYDIYVHYGVGPDRQSYLDLDKMLGQPDPITEELRELRRSGRASDEELKQMDSRKRVVVYIVDRDDEGEGVQAWAMSWTVDKDISVLSVDKGTNEVINVDDPENGYDIEFRRDGEGIKTKYSGIAIARRPSRLGRPEWLDYAIDNPIPDQLQYFSYDDIAKEFGGGGPDRGSSDARGEQHQRDDREGSGGGGRDRDRGGEDRGRRAPDTRDAKPEVTYEMVQAMTSAELDALCADHPDLKDCDPNKAKTDEELIGWICEDLKLSPAAPARTRVSASPETSPDDRLARMREERVGRR